MSDRGAPRQFKLVRDEGSGTEVIAYGTEFDDESCEVYWLTDENPEIEAETSGLVSYPGGVEQVHWHNVTQVEWMDDPLEESIQDAIDGKLATKEEVREAFQSVSNEKQYVWEAEISDKYNDFVRSKKFSKKGDAIDWVEKYDSDLLPDELNGDWSAVETYQGRVRYQNSYSEMYSVKVYMTSIN